MLVVEAITVCVGYDDFLNIIAPHNRGLFDRWLVVTTQKDKDTIEVCRKWNLDVLVIEDNLEFNKGLMIQRAQRMLSKNAWRLHIDSDIVLPTTFRNSLHSADLDPKMIYGCDRVMVKSYADWLNLRNSGYLSHQHDYHCRVIFPKGVEVGARWASGHQGYVPIGFFQLWSADADEQISFQKRAYPSRHGDASRTDTQHGMQWDRRQRALLPEIIAVHLESEESEMGTNWNGRKTKRFGPEKAKSELSKLS